MCNHLALCHEIIIEEVDNQIKYNASSPDELALINWTKMMGYQYRGINENDVITIINPDGESELY